MPVYEKTNLNLALRVNVALGVVFFCFFIIGLRLWYLQIVKGDYFREKSESNRIRIVYVRPPRGLIYDRDGVVLAKNRPAFNIELVPEDCPDPKQIIKRVAQITGQPAEKLMAQVREHRKRHAFEAKIVLKDVSRDVVAKIAARRYELPGIIITVTPARDYVYGDLAAHVLGYIREITNEQLQRREYARYRMRDLVGQYGIERVWEKFLQGSRGAQAVIVNATGSTIGEAWFEPDKPGRNITLTLDVDVQRAADEALKDQAGAIVAMDPNSGEILALSSSPRFDPNSFAKELSAAEWAALQGGKEKRMHNRAVQGTYPPGSVFKIIMAVAGLSEGVISKNEIVNCPGYLNVGNRLFRCHKKEGHGAVNLFLALVQSCDVYFYTLGNRLGVDRIHDYAVRFGLGTPSGLELLQDNVTGLIPSTAWKKARFSDPENQKWYPGETPSVAIGQGAVTVTPMEITKAVSALINGGFLMKPYLVRKIESSDGTLIDDDFQPQIMGKVGVAPEVLSLVREALVGVVNDPRGTGKRAKLSPDLDVTVAGKTGTAQVIGAVHGITSKEFKDHAWFVGYAPAEKPEIVVTALVENGGHGGAVAAPLVKKVMEAFFYKRLKVESISTNGSN